MSQPCGHRWPALASILTLPKLHLATFKLIISGWAWGLVPERPVVPQVKWAKWGAKPWQPCERQPPRPRTPSAWRAKDPWTGRGGTWTHQFFQAPDPPSHTSVTGRDNKPYIPLQENGNATVDYWQNPPGQPGQAPNGRGKGFSENDNLSPIGHVPQVQLMAALSHRPPKAGLLRAETAATRNEG